MKLSQQLIQAIEHYKKGIATDEELVMLNEFYDSFNNDSTEVLVPEVGDRATIERNAWAAITNRIQEKNTVQIRKSTGWRKLFAAASILVLFVSVYLVWRSGKRDVALVTANVNDRAPGKAKAVLILEDGTSIALDDAKNGNLAQQGNVRVIKLDSGKLAYQPVADDGSVLLAARRMKNTIQTPRGGQYQVVLPDGSKVWLNTSSSIKFPALFAETERSVEITGEVYMEVAKDVRRPFIVEADGMRIDVLGTSFNVNTYKDKGLVQTTLVSGSIKVKAADKEVLLLPGQQLNTGNNTLIVKKNSNVEQVLAWKNGLFQFDNSDLPELLKQAERWYDIEVKYKGKVPSIKLNGKMDRGVRLSGLIRFLGDYGINAQLDGRILTVSE